MSNQTLQLIFPLGQDRFFYPCYPDHKSFADWPNRVWFWQLFAELVWISDREVEQSGKDSRTSGDSRNTKCTLDTRSESEDHNLDFQAPPEVSDKFETPAENSKELKEVLKLLMKNPSCLYGKVHQLWKYNIWLFLSQLTRSILHIWHRYANAYVLLSITTVKFYKRIV